jgi:hypothetical protein
LVEGNCAQAAPRGLLEGKPVLNCGGYFEVTAGEKAWFCAPPTTFFRGRKKRGLEANSAGIALAPGNGRILHRFKFLRRKRAASF